MARLVAFWPVALAGGVALIVAGCTADPTPIATETPTAVASASPTPTPTASPSPTALTPDEVLAAIPENARGEDFASASEFAKFFVVLWGEVLQSKDTSLFEALSDEGCTFCIATLDSLDEYAVAGIEVRGGSVEVGDELAAGGLQDDGSTNASFDIVVASSANLGPDGGVMSEFPQEELRVGVLLAFRDDHWVVLDVGSEPR